MSDVGSCAVWRGEAGREDDVGAGGAPPQPAHPLTPEQAVVSLPGGGVDQSRWEPSHTGTKPIRGEQ